MKAILIESSKRLITPQEINTLEDVYRMIGDGATASFRSYIIKYNGDEVPVNIFVNDSAMFCDPEHFFLMTGNTMPMSGNGLVVGVDGKDDADVTCGLLELAANVSFKDKVQLLMEGALL